MIEALHQRDCQCRITWVCGQAVESLLQTFGKIEEIIAIDEKKLLAGSMLEKAAVLMSLWARLCGRTFDMVLTGHSDPRYRWLSLPALGRVRRTFGRTSGRVTPVPGRLHSD